MAHCLIPGNQMVQPFRSHLQFDLSVLSITYPVICFSFLFAMVKWSWSLLKNLKENFQYGKEDKDLCVMTVSQTPSRGGDPPREAMYASDTRAWRLPHRAYLPNKWYYWRESRSIWFPLYVLKTVRQHASGSLEVNLKTLFPVALENCILKADVFQDWTQWWGFCDKGRGIVVVSNSKLCGHVRLVYRIIWWIRNTLVASCHFCLLFNEQYFTFHSSFQNSWHK